MELPIIIKPTPGKRILVPGAIIISGTSKISMIIKHIIRFLSVFIFYLYMKSQKRFILRQGDYLIKDYLLFFITFIFLSAFFGCSVFSEIIERKDIAAADLKFSVRLESCFFENLLFSTIN